MVVNHLNHLKGKSIDSLEMLEVHYNKTAYYKARKATLKIILTLSSTASIIVDHLNKFKNRQVDNP